MGELMKLDVLICHRSKSAGVLLSNHLGGGKVINVELRKDIKASVKCAFEFQPNLIVVGSSFDDGDAAKLISELKKAPPTKRTPILAIPDDDSDNFTLSCHDAGVDGILGYPFNPEDFTKTVNLLTQSDTKVNYVNYVINKNQKILVVEDSLSYQKMYKVCIDKIGCNATFCDNGQEAWNALKEGLEVDMIITDVIMPVMDGKEFSALVRSNFKYDNIPLIVASTIEQHSTLKDFFSIGINDYFTKPLDDEIFACRVKAHLHTRQLIRSEELLKQELESFNDKLRVKVKEKTRELHEANLEVINKLAKVSEYKDDVTGSHILRVRAYTEVIARAIGMTEEKAEAVGVGSIMHDVGKIAIPDAILQKPGKLTDEERYIMEQHPIYGERLFSDLPFFKEAKLIAGGHHEKWDGSGYPRKLKGEDIPIEARLVALSDVFDALLSPRSYKKAFTIDDSVDIIKKGRGSHFDPMLVDCFLGLIENGVIGEIMERYPYEY